MFRAEGGAMKGRHPKSVAELKLHGTFRPGKHGDRLAEPAVEGLPEKPVGLKPDAEWLWDLVLAEYANAGPLKRIDTAAVMAACDLWSKYRAASKLADANPVDKETRIAVTAYYAAWERAASKIGINPVDRRRVRTEGEPKKAGLRSRVRA